MNPVQAARSGTPEHIAPGDTPPLAASLPGVDIREFVSGRCGAAGLSTGTATFAPNAGLACHIHDFSEVITLLDGDARVLVDDRAYDLNVYDSIHIPAGVPHAVRNPSASVPMTAHWAFACSEPSRHWTAPSPVRLDLSYGNPRAGDPEHITRFRDAEVYELSPGAFFRDLFAGRFGAVGICGGYGRFRPGASLPCHFHNYDESITIVEGGALCLVEGNRYEVSGYATAFVPVGKPHRFINEADREMAMIWVYAGSEPERTLVDSAYCTGELVWPGAGRHAASPAACSSVQK
jgi:quercetin dioxygenase-like cupin family protein